MWNDCKIKQRLRKDGDDNARVFVYDVSTRMHADVNFIDAPNKPRFMDENTP